MTAKSSDVWRNLATGDGQRVREDGRFDFFWAVLEDRSPALVLFLPELPTDNERLPRLKNLEAGFRMLSRPAFYLKLIDASQRQLFYVLCKDVVEAAEAAETLEGAMERAIRRTQRWHFLLKGGNTGGLAIEAQRGLVGELAFLRELCRAIGPLSAIEAWLGPEGSSKDFEFPRCCVEIKSRRSAAKPHVSISSVDQLSDVDGASLYLRVYNVDGHAAPDGDNLHDHVAHTAKHFDDHTAACDLWEDRICATGYTPDGEYAGTKWTIGAVKTYAVIDGFPRLVPPLPNGVANLTYSVSLDVCERFMAENDDAITTAKGDLYGQT